MGSASTQATADALAQEDHIEWIREIDIHPAADVINEAVIHSPLPFSNPVPKWPVGKLWAYAVLKPGAKPDADASGAVSYPRRIWFQIYDPRQIELEPQAAEAVRVKTESITAGKPSEPA